LAAAREGPRRPAARARPHRRVRPAARRGRGLRRAPARRRRADRGAPLRRPDPRLLRHVRGARRRTGRAAAGRCGAAQGARGVAVAVELYEALRTTRAVRRLRPDPIPDDVLHRVLEAATFAPTGGNTQPWRVVVVREAATKTALQRLYLPL